MRNVLTALLATGGLLAAAGSASGANVTATFNVTATVLKTCTTSATNLVFPNYTPGTGGVAATSTVSVNCTNKTPFTIALNGGTTTGGNIGQRLMGDGAGDTLEYNLFSDTNHTTLWGDGTTGGLTVAGTGAGMGAGKVQNSTVYGQVLDSATNQTAAASSAYTDTITVTVTY